MDQKLNTILEAYTRIILVGGGTGGHIQPIVSLTRTLKRTAGDIDFMWIGGAHSQEEKVAKEEEIHFESIPTLKLSTTHSFRVLLYPLFLFLGFCKARVMLKKYHTKDKETAVFSKGGPGSVAIGLAAWSLAIPLYIHESDTVPGRSNRILGKFASIVFLGFESASTFFDTKKCEVVGQILDPVFTERPTINSHNAVVWKTSKPHILVICGSQGSQKIFESIIAQFDSDDTYEWIVSLGKLNASMANAFSTLSDCQTPSWLSQENIAYLLQDTDIAITRGSATTLAELTSMDPIKPSDHQTIKPVLIIIPLPYSAGNHQYFNAIEYTKHGHTLLEQQNIGNLKNTLYTILPYGKNRTKAQ